MNSSDERAVQMLLRWLRKHSPCCVILHAFEGQLLLGSAQKRYPTTMKEYIHLRDAMDADAEVVPKLDRSREIASWITTGIDSGASTIVRGDGDVADRAMHDHIRTSGRVFFGSHQATAHLRE